MPIMNENNIKIFFGIGDIAIKTGCKENKSPGVIQFIEVEPSSIGKPMSICNDEKLKIEEAPVSLVFNKIESLDVVINQLLKLRRTMGGN